jgi:hypothetical protein
VLRCGDAAKYGDDRGSTLSDDLEANFCCVVE